LKGEVSIVCLSVCLIDNTYGPSFKSDGYGCPIPTYFYTKQTQETLQMTLSYNLSGAVRKIVFLRILVTFFNGGSYADGNSFVFLCFSKFAHCCVPKKYNI